MPVSRIVAIALATAVFATTALARNDEQAAIQVVAAAKRATGADVWDTVSGLHLEGAGGGARFKMWFDLHNYGQRVELVKDGATVVQGFNGKLSWTVAAGKTSLDSNPDNLVMAGNGAYFGSNAFFFPARFKATFRYLRQVQESTARFDVIEVTPEGGKPVELWFNRKTRLLDRFVDRMGPQVITIAQSDYRWEAGVLVPHQATVTDPNGKVLEEGHSDRIAPYEVDRKQFDPPAP